MSLNKNRPDEVLVPIPDSYFKCAGFFITFASTQSRGLWQTQGKKASTLGCPEFHIFTYVNVYGITDIGINQIKNAIKSIIIRVYTKVELGYYFSYK